VAASVTGAVGSVTGNVGGNVTGSVGSVAAGGISASSLAADAITAAKIAADAVAEIQSGLSTLDAAGVRTAVGLASANLDTQLTAIDDYLDTEVAAIKAKTDNLPAAPAATGDIPSAASIADAVWDEATTSHTTSGTFGEQVKTDIDAILVDTAEIGAAGAGLTAVPWNASWDAEVQSEVADALEEAVADSIPADGSRPSVKQALYMLTQFMVERSVSSTTVTVKKPDGSTSLFTLTLNDATSPTSITRAS
jgi:hypothetical protein